MGDFGVFPAPGQADFLQQRHLRRWAENFQKVWYEKSFLKKFRKTSELSRNIFWASSDHVVAQKSIFWKKIFEKVTISGTPPV